MMFKVEDKGLIFRTSASGGLSFIALATGREKAEAPGDQCFVCRHEALF